MSTFNHKRLKQQELLAKEDCELLLTIIDHAKPHLTFVSKERIEFLKTKLERMKK